VTSVRRQRLDIETKALRLETLKSIKSARYQPPCVDGDLNQKMLSSHDVLSKYTNEERRKRGRKVFPFNGNSLKKRQIEVNNIRIPFIPKWVLETTARWGRRLTSSASKFVFIRLTVISPFHDRRRVCLLNFYICLLIPFPFNNRHHVSVLHHR
jgi:hypothetical protein